MTSLNTDELEPVMTRAPGPERIILGGRFGEEPPELSWQRLDRFVEAGGRYVDTAHSYANGDSERVIGEWLRANPDGVGIVDKIGHPDDSGHLDLTAMNLQTELATSRERLGVDKIDVLLVHRDSLDTPIRDIAETLAGFVTDGLAKRVGVSNWTAERLEQLVDALATARGQVPVAASYQRSLAEPQAPLWPGSRHADQAILKVVEHWNLPMLAWAAHARGYFTGTIDLPRAGIADPFDTMQNQSRRRRCEQLADDLGARPESVALSWLLHQPSTCPIVGPQSIEELNVSLAATQLHFSAETLRWLEEGEP